MLEGAVSLVLGSVIIADQALKTAALRLLRRRELHLGARVRIRAVGGSRTFASRAGIPKSLAALLWVAITAAAFVAMSNVAPLASPVARAAIAAALGGAASNLIDEVARGGVVDYVDLRVWPAFNLADVAIVTGVVLTLVAAVAGGSG